MSAPHDPTRRRRRPSNRHDAHGAFARAVVHAAGSPLLLLDDGLRVVAASAGYREAFPDPGPEDKPLCDLTGGAWQAEPIQALLAQVRAGRPGGSIETEVQCPEGVKPVRVRVAAAETGGGAIVVSIEDLTGRQPQGAMSAQVREATALLRETQHRTANSLAIIATILNLKARQAASPEARGELESIRRRVLALALIERHLQFADPYAPTPVAPFLETLCTQLSASLVGEDRPVNLRVEAGPGSQPRRAVVILGLAITELIINALKHAFGDDEPGEILVEYAQTADGWRAAVSDNGRGGGGSTPASSGSGTAIVAALAAQLGAELRRDASQGLRVELVAAKPQASPV